MIQENELRIGNYVQDFTGRIGKVTSIGNREVRLKMESSTLKINSACDLEGLDDCLNEQPEAITETAATLANTILGELPPVNTETNLKEPAAAGSSETKGVRQNEQIQKDCTTCRHLSTCEPFEEPCFSCTTLDNTFSLWEGVQSE